MRNLANKVSGRWYSIDPGLRGCGVAEWDDTKLVGAWYITGSATLSQGAALWGEMIRAVNAHVCKRSSAFKLVIELPKVYRAGNSKGDPEDLIQLAAVVGGLSAISKGTAIYRPSEWKGTVPKEVMTQRIILHVTPEEYKTCVLPTPSLQHNVWDAVGIGLFHCGRIGGFR